MSISDKENEQSLLSHEEYEAFSSADHPAIYSLDKDGLRNLARFRALDVRRHEAGRKHFRHHQSAVLGRGLLAVGPEHRRQGLASIFRNGWQRYVAQVGTGFKQAPIATDTSGSAFHGSRRMIALR